MIGLKEQKLKKSSPHSIHPDIDTILHHCVLWRHSRGSLRTRDALKFVNF